MTIKKRNNQVKQLSINDWGVLFGYGLFETMRLYNGVPFLLEEHILRLLTSSHQLYFHCKYSKEELEQKVTKYISTNNLKNEALRLTLSFGNQIRELPPQVFITHRSVPYKEKDYQNGINVLISEFKKNEFSPIVQHKTCNQLENVLMYQFCKENNVKESIFLNTSGFIAEGSKSNLFFIRNEIAYTPSVECGILPGITRSKTIDLLKKQNIPIEEGYYTLHQLYTCDECFCTNSLMEIMPIVKIGGIFLGNGQPGKISQSTANLYRECTE